MMEIDNKQEEKTSKKSPIIPGQKKEAEFFKESSENQHKTIMPTMIDESEEYMERQRDLSAIIPSFEEMDDNANSTELVSRDNMFKSDGTVTLAYINEAGEVTVSNGAKIPEQIDMEQRKKEFAESKNVKKQLKKERKDRRKARQTKRQQNTIAFGSLAVIIFLIGFAYWFFNHKTELDFQPKRVEVELGEALPPKKTTYITPGVGLTLDEMYYVIDFSQVRVEEPGEYTYIVTYKKGNQKATKTGKIVIKDTKPPEMEVRTVSITEGGTYDAATFVASCRDPSGCNFSFQDSETERKYTSAGSYVVYIVATDAFQNSVTKKASLIIEAQGNLRIYSKQTNFDANLGYELKEKYELHFRDNTNNGVLVNGKYEKVFIYQDQEKYEAASKELRGEQGYSFSDSDLIITYTETANIVGNNYTYTDDIHSYLIHEGFTRES